MIRRRRPSEPNGIAAPQKRRTMPAARRPKQDDDVGRVTPMMEQYVEIKAANPDACCFYRMGDSDEMFFHDAEVASRALGIMLTKRGKHLGQGHPDVRRSGRAARRILHPPDPRRPRARCCEQMEDPAEAKKRGAKSVVKRDVVRLVTPARDRGHAARRAAQQHLVAIVRDAPPRPPADDSRFALAFLDISTGEFRLTECDRVGLAAELARARAGRDHRVGCRSMATPTWAAALARAAGRDAAAARRVRRRHRRAAGWVYFAVATTDAFGSFTRIELTAAAACITYVERTQLGKRPPLSPPMREQQARRSRSMPRRAQSRGSCARSRASGRGSLGRRSTAAWRGGLAPAGERLAAPADRSAAINTRLDAVAAFRGRAALRGDVRRASRRRPTSSARSPA